MASSVTQLMSVGAMCTLKDRELDVVWSSLVGSGKTCLYN